jgi:UDP-N-acetylmuramate dehydrogenase
MSAAYAIADEVSLRDLNTLRVDVRARSLATVHDPAALPALLADPRVRDLPVLVLGEGSNVLFANERFDGVVLRLECDACEVVADAGTTALVRVEAARRWDPLVDWTLERGFRGLENLALIPGHAGAAPIQNIGAYGIEVGEFVETVEAFDRKTRQPRNLASSECEFGYRDSAFKRDPERWIVTAVTLKLPRGGACNLGYAGLREELLAMGGLTATPTHVADAVRRIRRRKLPDPAVIGNAGSFFKNPLVAATHAASMLERHPAMPVFAGPDAQSRKLSAAWLIEHAGWRGFREGAAGISAQHALVLVNHGGATGAQLLGVARRVADSVHASFGVRLEPEPRIVGAAF